MFKRIILVAATLAVIAVAYAIFHWQDETLPLASQREAPPPLTRPVATRPTTAPGAAISFKDGWVAGGEAPVLRVYDKKGNTRIIFRATRWNPISDNEFDLVEPTVRLTLPGGQLAYIWADEGRVTVLQGEDDNPVAKRGHLRGNVRLFVDLTDEEWRSAHPDKADPDQHPESMVKLWLDHVRFDLDLSFLDSDGPILLQSAPGDLEGRGLKIVWNELDRRIQQLVINEGRRAVLRNADVAGVSASGAAEGKTTAHAPSAPAEMKAASAPARRQAGPRVARIVQPAEPGALPYIELSRGEERPVAPRVETYRLVFHDRVVASQKENGRVIGGLQNADTLELLFDFNQAERRALGPAGTRPAGSEPATAPARTPMLAQSPTGGGIELTWSGSLEITPEQAPAGEGAEAARAHLIAKGPAVEVYSRDAGRVISPELEYRHETSQIWLRGTGDRPVVLEPNERQQITAHGTIWADQKKGTARIDGAGRLTRRDPDQAASGPADAGRLFGGEFRNVEITWNGAVDLEFATTESAPAASAPAGVSPIPKGAYLKHALFTGGATFSDDRQSISADRIDVAFGNPRQVSGAGEPTSNWVVEHVTATGRVRMTVCNEDTLETVECEALDVEVGMDDVGNNVARVARVTGQVAARQTGRLARWGPGAAREIVLREITAEDGLILDLASVPRIVSPQEIARKEAAARARARERGIAEGSAEWKRYEEQLRRGLQRRQTVATRLRARGRVTVFDVKQELDLAADSIDCELGRGREEIRKALIVGRTELPARVAIGDFFIRGPRIDVDVETQSAEVPGAGTLRFMSRQDLDGRAVDKAIPVVVTWDDRMSLAGDRNSGRIVGNVRAVSQTVTLDCTEEMLLEFENIAEPEAPASRPAEQQHRWIFGMIADAARAPARPASEKRADRQLRKRLRSLEAIRDAVIEANVYREDGAGATTPLAAWVRSTNDFIADLLTPAGGPPATRPAEVAARKASRVRVAGPRILVRLDDKQMLVQGAGHLLVEDYRPQAGRRAPRGPAAGGSLLDGTAVASLESLGPSQTVFTWNNSMSFLNDRNLAIFDSGVEMRHLSGSKMIELAWVASQMGVDPQVLRQRPGREASLNCDRFTVEFERDPAIRPGQPAPLSRATRLKGFWAVGRQVRLEESGRFVEGTHVSYDSATQIGRVSGSDEFPARFCLRDERTGQATSSRVEQFEWDQKTGTIRVRDPRVLTTGR